MAKHDKKCDMLSESDVISLIKKLKGIKEVAVCSSKKYPMVTAQEVFVTVNIVTEAGHKHDGLFARLFKFASRSDPVECLDKHENLQRYFRDVEEFADFPRLFKEMLCFHYNSVVSVILYTNVTKVHPAQPAATSARQPILSEFFKPAEGASKAVIEQPRLVMSDNIVVLGSFTFIFFLNLDSPDNGTVFVNDIPYCVERGRIHAFHKPREVNIPTGTFIVNPREVIVQRGNIRTRIHMDDGGSTWLTIGGTAVCVSEE